MIPAEQLQDILDTAKETLVIRNLHEIDRRKDLEQQQSKLKGENAELKVKSERDELTGAFNRRAFDLAVENEFSVATMSKSPLSLVFVDIDRSRAINDTHGHQGGDMALRAVADILRATLRESDMVARYGGDEFVLLLPGTDSEKADLVAGRLLERVRQAQFNDTDGKPMTVTLSLGIATHHAGSGFSSAKDFIAAADRAVYHSKRNGRNQHTLFDRIRAA